MSACADGLRHGGEDLEPRVKAGEAENCGHQGRRGSQTQATAQKADPAGDANQHGKPARIAEGHPGQIDDEPAGTRPQQAEELLTQHGCTRDVDFAADLHDGVTIFTADGKCRGRRDMIDFMRRHRRPPISVPAKPGCGAPKATLVRLPGVRGALGPTHSTLRRPSRLRRAAPIPSHSVAVCRADRRMVLNEAGCSRSSCPCHSAREILTAGAVGFQVRPWKDGRSPQPGMHAACIPMIALSGDHSGSGNSEAIQRGQGLWFHRPR